MKKLSIIIPVYNVEKYLQKCLDSVLCCEETGYEVIAVNDGSTDTSGAILAEYKKQYQEKLTVISKENGGLGSARNAGLIASESEYVVFLDSDDWYSENAVNEMLKCCGKDFDICFFDFVSVTENGRFIKYLTGCSKISGEFTLESNPSILYELPSGTNKIFRRALFTDNNIFFPDRAWFEDLRTTPKLYTFADKMIYMHNGWYYYRQQSDSITHGSAPMRNLEIIDAVEDIVSYYKEVGLYDKYREEIEFAVFYNEFLTSVDRVNLIDKNSIIQDKLSVYFIRSFPDFRSNKYVRKMNLKHKLILYLIYHRYFGLLNFVLNINNKVKGKL